ncbi:MAG: hypothetical protein KKB50_13515 [Planctomycetes bacterium]|nr:hypothetical protein [Planctomycetota bacterium]
MKHYYWRGRMVRIWLASGTVLLLGGCGLSDQQLTSILQSVVATGLSTLVTSILSGLLSAAGLA